MKLAEPTCPFREDLSLVVRPTLPAPREGWIYVAASCGLADALGEGAALEWPDEVWIGDARAGALGVFVQIGAGGVDWAVVNVLVECAPPPRAPLLARAVEAIESRLGAPAVPVLAAYLRRCTTIGVRVRARTIPLGPGGLVLEGRASSVLQDGALVLETDDGRRLAVRPGSLGLLDRI